MGDPRAPVERQDQLGPEAVIAPADDVRGIKARRFALGEGAGVRLIVAICEHGARGPGTRPHATWSLFRDHRSASVARAAWLRTTTASIRLVDHPDAPEPAEARSSASLNAWHSGRRDADARCGDRKPFGDGRAAWCPARPPRRSNSTSRFQAMTPAMSGRAHCGNRGWNRASAASTACSAATRSSRAHRRSTAARCLACCPRRGSCCRRATDASAEVARCPEIDGLSAMPARPSHSPPRLRAVRMPGAADERSGHRLRCGNLTRLSGSPIRS